MRQQSSVANILKNKLLSGADTTKLRHLMCNFISPQEVGSAKNFTKSKALKSVFFKTCLNH
jgi:hypothetical protein